MEMYVCVGCNSPVYAYHTPALFPGDDGGFPVHTQWVHVHPPAIPHEAVPLYQIEE